MKRTGDDGSTAGRRSTALERSLTQRLDALERANLVRTRRAKLKLELKAGRCSIDMLLQDPPDYVETAKVMDMLLAVPKYGRVKVNKILTQCRISPSKTIGGLSERQRRELARLLRTDPRDQQQAPRPAAPTASSSPSAAAATVQRETAPADEELILGLGRLLEDAREVGRCAGRAARDAGVKLDAGAPRPDTVRLQAALARTLREPGLVLASVAPRSVSDDPPHTTAPCAGLIATPGEGQLDALRRVNEVRLARAELKRRVSSGAITAREVILTCPWEAAGMTIAELLTSQRRWGATRCSTFLAGIGLPETKTIGSMTERQRRLLASLL